MREFAGRSARLAFSARELMQGQHFEARSTKEFDARAAREVGR